MIEQNVQVVRCLDDRMWVRMGSQSGCSNCDNGKGCGAGLFARLVRHKPVVVELERNDLQVEPGQMVTLAFPEQVYLKLVLASYGWPLLAALGSAYAAFSVAGWLQFGPGLIDAMTLAGGGLGAFWALRYTRRKGGADRMLSSLKMTACHPSPTPDMCARGQRGLT